MSDKTDLDENAKTQSPLSAMAENLLGVSPRTINELKEQIREEIMHELQVHQIELEMQNEELKRLQLESEASKTKYQDLYDFAPVAYFTLSHKGIITEVNRAGASLLGTHRSKLIHRRFARFVTPEYENQWYQHIISVGKQQEKQGCDVKIKKNDGSTFYAHIESIRIETPSGRQETNGEAHEVLMVVNDITERRQAEEERLASLIEIQDLYHNAPCGYHSLDSDGKFVRVNQTESMWLGYTIDEMLGGMKFTDILTSGSLKTFEKNFPAFKQRGSIKDLKFELVRKDGTVFPVLLNATAIKGPFGEYIMSRSTVFDITEQERNQKILLQSEQRYKALYEDSCDGVLLMDESTAILDANNKAIEIFGYSLTELRSKKVSDLIDLQSSETKSSIFEMMLVGETIRLEQPMFTKSGELIFVELTARRVGKNLFQTICRDVTERKLAEEELKNSEERFKAIFEGSNDFIFIKDLSFRYTHINPVTLKLWGIPESEMLGKTSEDLLPKQEAQTIRELDTRALRGESVEDVVTRKIRGVQMTLHEVRMPMYNGSGEITGIFVICRDITDFHKATVIPKLDSQEYSSQAMRAVFEQASFAAAGKSIILLLGESGAGKDYIAKYIHERSNYSSGPYFSINCASIPSELAESELFGHEAGAFTGAGRRKRGLLELAEGGTLLLNEVGELSPALQAKLLTFLDTRTFTRVGGQQEIRVNTRILAATNRDLQNEISTGRFRADLYYRLNVFSIRVPPLRERTEDLPILVAQLLPTLAKDLQMGFPQELAAGEMAKLYNYQWPGNVRELKNVLERAIILSGGGAIKLDIEGSGPCDAVSSQSRVTNIGDTSTLADSMQNLSRAMIEEALTRARGRKELAASYLGVSRYTLRRRIQKLGIDVRK